MTQDQEKAAEPAVAYRQLAEARQVCPTTTKRMATEGAVLVDVRERDEINRLAFDVPNLVEIPLGQLEERFVELPRDRDLVMVCQGGGRSLRATYFLMYQGFEHVANMDGGIMKWAAKGFPVKGAKSAEQLVSQKSGSCCGSDATSPSTSGCCDATAPGTGAGCC